MFSPKTRNWLFLLPICVLALLTANVEAQTTASAQFQARMAAMQQAQARGQASQQYVETQPVARVAQATTTRVPRQMIPASNSTVVTSARTASRGYQPAHMRTAQLISNSSVIQGSSPIVGETVVAQPAADGGAVVGNSVVTDTVVGPVDSGIMYEEVVASGCDSCGDSCGYFQDDCCGRGGCPDMPCWQGPLGRAIRNGSYFFGSTAFRHPAYQSPVGTDLVQDSNFGAYGGFNLSIPLCRLFCGKISGQFGLRSVQTNFRGSDISDSHRDQLFLTAGLFRRVDYGLQAGVVVDVLAEDYFTESTIAQLRGEVSWAYPSGGAIGFRFATSQQTDTSPGTFAGNRFDEIFTTTDEHYRFFLRKVSFRGGWEELYLGWSNNEQFVLGGDLDIPLAQYVALEAGAVYYMSDAEAPNSNLRTTRIDDAFNIYVGFAFRPQGMAYYRSYDRPMLPVADNGTMVIRR